MNKREMRHVQKIFDRSWSASLIIIGDTVDFVKSRVIPLGKRGNVKPRSAQRYPDPVISLLRLVDFYARPGRWRLLRMSGNSHALSFLIVSPTMVGTNQDLVFNFAQREAGATGQAEITPDMDLRANPPQNQILIPQTHRPGLALHQNRGIRDDVPIVDK